MKEIATAIYERRILEQVKKGRVPKHIILVISEDNLMEENAWKRLKAFVEWCSEIGIQNITVYISIVEVGDLNKKVEESLLSTASKVFSMAKIGIAIFTKGKQQEIKTGQPQLTIVIGYGGKYELTNAIREIMKKVKAGEIEVEDIDEKLIEAHLTFKIEPDLIIRADSKRLIDFLIWQAVYSELYFTDISWRDFRKIDFLRAIRDFQRRNRRFGA
ncbi:MAG: undecaprenyl diphosphate synthase family protein [Methanocellales archaeon]